MCGILISYSKSQYIDTDNFKRSLELQKHRGPDNTGIIRVSEKLIIGNVRLSITDLSKNSNQPMVNKFTSNIISFNGDIYNYVELRDYLKNKGISFFSAGDTEVLLKYLEFKGISGINELNGKWAFVFYNKKENKLIVSRDRFGKQPLYYYNDHETIIFSSEIKSIYNLLKKKRTLKKNIISDYLKFGYIPNENEETIYNEINRILPGVTACIDLNQNNVKFEFKKNNTIKNHLEKKSSLNLEDLIYDSVKIRLRTDVKSAVVVSGGVDSSLISTIAHTINKDISFISGDAGTGQDLYFSRKLAKDLNIHLEEIKFNFDHDIISRIEKMTNIFEIPLNLNGQVIAMNILYEKVSSLGIKVLLDGSGGDEIYAGYFDRYTQFFINSLVINKKFSELFQFIFYSLRYNQTSYKLIIKYLIQKFGNLLFNLNFKNKLFKFIKLDHDLNPSRKDKIFYSLEKYQLWDNEFGTIPIQLQLSDSNAMMYSMTTRNPLLDYRQIYNIKNKTNLKFYKGFNKYLLRNKITNDISPEIKWRRDKQPLRWFGHEILFNKYDKIVKESVLESQILKNLYSKENLEYLFSNKILKKNKELCLRLFALSMLGKVYNCDIN
jgi:asparagine synthase (glutamine-hydrolysing)